MVGALGTDQDDGGVEAVGELLDGHVAEGRAVAQVGNDQHLVLLALQAQSQFQVVAAAVANPEPDLDEIAQSFVKWGKEQGFSFLQDN